MEVWAALRSLGRNGLAELVERNCRLAQRFAAGLRQCGCTVLNDVVLNQVMVSFGDPSVAEYVIGSAAADTLSRAVVHAILSAESTPCEKSYCDLFPNACRNRKKGAQK